MDFFRKLRVWWFCGMGFHKASHSRWTDSDNKLRTSCLNCRKTLMLVNGGWLWYEVVAVMGFIVLLLFVGMGPSHSKWRDKLTWC